MMILRDEPSERIIKIPSEENLFLLLIMNGSYQLYIRFCQMIFIIILLRPV